MSQTEALEASRLDALARCALLDTPPEPSFDRITRLASAMFDVPMALVTLVDAERQWFKSRVGVDALYAPRGGGFCELAITLPEVMVVEDARRDPRFADSPLVTGAPHIRFYAGAPLTTRDGFRIGTLCLLDTKPRSLDYQERERLSTLGDFVMEAVTLRTATSAALRDVATLTEQQRRLEEQQTHIRKLAEEMTSLAEENMAAKLAAEAALEQRALFVAAMVHELRTPLVAVLGLSELLAHEAYGPLGSAKYLEFAGMIHTSGSHLLSLINDLLDLSKLNAGKFDVTLTSTELLPLLHSVMRVMASLAKDKQVSLTLSTYTEALRGLADERAFQQVLFNLLSNAIKFTSAGGRVHVTAEATSTGHRFTVSDSGDGIAPLDLERLVRPYAQGPQTSSQRGTGLGLTVCAKLLELHGSKLELSSEPGLGTRASFVIRTGEV